MMCPRHASLALRLLIVATCCSLLVTLLGCTPRRATTPPNAGTPPPPADPWVITTTSPAAGYRPTYLGNGYLGQVMDAGGLGMTGGSAGPGEQPAAVSGTAPHLLPGPQPASLAGLYNQGSMVTLPPLFPLAVERDDKRFGADPARLHSYTQTLDMRHGVLTTRATWEGAPVEITAFLSRAQPGLAVCHVVAPPEVKVRDAAAELKPGMGLRLQQQESGAGDLVTTHSRRVVMRQSRLFAPDGPSSTGRVATTRVGWIGSAGPSIEKTIRVPAAALQSPKPGESPFEPLLRDHQAAWRSVWRSDIEIEGSPADQQLVRALLYQVLASVREDVSPPPGYPPMGLSNPAAFGGHVFWDADTWIFPALLPLHPALARTILDYRFHTLPGAKANAKAEGKPGATYAWESADTGRETITLETRHGRHVSADVALAHWQYFLATGDRAWLRQRAWPVLAATADYWTARATLVPRNGSSSDGGTPATQYEIRRVSTPDENAGLVDNSAWTNFGARENLRIAARVARLLNLPANPRWETVAGGLLIPRDPTGMILEYAGYQGRPAKQADTLLLLFPGEIPLPRAEQERMFRYYVDRTIRTGPAMTESVHAVIAARLGRPEEAYRRFRLSVDPFVRPPFYSFSEKRTRDHMQFLTGAAGALQAVLYGFAGLHLRDSPEPVFKPQLPPGWTGLTLRNFHWRSNRFDVSIRRGQPPRLTRR